MIKVQEFTKEYSLVKSNNLIENPMVSIILCIMGQQSYSDLMRLIDSTLNQTYKNFELILIDDGQNDNLIKNILEPYIKNDNKIVYISNVTKSNLISLRINQGLSFARGKYVNYQFVGSYITEDYLESLVSTIENQNRECLVYGKCEFELSNSKDTYVLGTSFNYADFIYYNNIVPNNAVIHHLSIINEYGLMDCSVMLKETFFWDFLLRISSNIKLIHLDKVISKACSFKEVFNDIYLDNFSLRTFRNIQFTNRNDLFTLNKINDYVVDDISLVNGYKFKKQIFLKYILTWYSSTKVNYLGKDVSVKEKENLLVVKADFDTSLDVMFTNFIKVLNDKYNMIYIPSSQLNEEVLENVDVAIFHRTYDFASNHFLEKLKCRNIPVSYWIDDDLLNFYKLKDEYEDLSPLLAAQKRFEFSVPGTSIYNELEYQLKNVDAVVSYSSQISNSVRKYNDKIIELKLTVMMKYLERKVSKNLNAFKIAFIGTDSRRAEIKFLWKDLLDISNKYKDKIEFYFWGYVPENIDDISCSKVYTEDFTTSYYEYMNRLNSEDFDIVVSPLFNVEPKLAKGLTKYIEAAVCGAIGVYSNVKPYEVVEDNINGFKFENNKGELSKKIEEIIEMDFHKKEMIFENAKRDIIENNSTESEVYHFQAGIEAIKLHKFFKQQGSICFVFYNYCEYNKQKFLKYVVYAKKYNFNIVVCILNQNKNEFKNVYDVCMQNDIELNYVNYNDKSQLINLEDIINNNKEFIDMTLNKDIRLFHSYNLIPLVEATSLKLGIIHICSIFQGENIDIGEGYMQYVPKYIISNSLDYLNLFVESNNIYPKFIEEVEDLKNDFYKNMYSSLKFYNDVIKSFNSKEYYLQDNDAFWNRVYENISKKLKVDDYITFRKFFVGVKEQIKSLLMDKNYREVPVNYIIWGASNAGKITKEIIDEAFPNFKLVAFIDKYKKGELEGYNIYSPEDLKNIKFNYAFIATSPGRYDAEKSLALLQMNHCIDYLVLFA